MRAVSYAAESSPDERESLRSQLAAIRAAAESEGRTILAEYADEDASAYSGSRGPDLIAAREHAERLVAEHGECELWVFDPDRLARGCGKKGTAHLAQIYWWSVEVGVTLRSVETDHALHDPIGRYRELAEAGVQTAIVGLGDARGAESVARFADVIGAFGRSG